jgi:hypothetical protein
MAKFAAFQMLLARASRRNEFEVRKGYDIVQLSNP